VVREANRVGATGTMLMASTDPQALSFRSHVDTTRATS
jgi:hypothetical protein